MQISKKEPIILLLGDILVLYLSLFFMLLTVRPGLPESVTTSAHILPFTFLFVVWIFIFFVAGLYEKHTVILKNKLPNTILNTQVTNSFVAVLFFYLIPYFGITPKTNLFIYLVVSFILLIFWRVYLFNKINISSRKRALLVGSKEEMRDLFEEVNNNSRYDIIFTDKVDLDDIKGAYILETLSKKFQENIFSVVVIDLKHPTIKAILPQIFSLFKNKIEIINKQSMYEEIFDREPISMIDYEWFIENISLSPKLAYDPLKRATDFFIAFVGGLFSLILFIFVVPAIRFDSKGPVFYRQKRVGKDGEVFEIIKFRTMEKMHTGEEATGGDNQITKVGKVLRMLRIDELPQLWNVLKGELSLIGPRPEIPELVEVYEKEIPYYGIRHFIKPGLSGWAQIHQAAPPKFGTNLNDTTTKLSYDLYYIKNRSFMLDLKIIFRTIKTLLSRSGV